MLSFNIGTMITQLVIVLFVLAIIVGVILLLAALLRKNSPKMDPGIETLHQEIQQMKQRITQMEHRLAPRQDDTQTTKR
ncbi:hypothetical protein [Marininema halotolerans]|uniref:Uncharacterized protein n=1 Tax=Marininema halotolerans TaxID=1155944 RepID=A0A1I6U2N8_9BACL|nr:hypothetical protein [Marininema halotolerans]SFS95628.1 hypothetical protein SAMN05444972_11313 [Marininema halotolerans]